MIDLSEATVGSEWKRRDGVKVVCVAVRKSEWPFEGDDRCIRLWNGAAYRGETNSLDIIAPWEEADPQTSEPSYEERLRDEVAMRVFLQALDYVVQDGADQG